MSVCVNAFHPFLDEVCDVRLFRRSIFDTVDTVSKLSIKESYALHLARWASKWYWYRFIGTSIQYELLVCSL